MTRRTDVRSDVDSLSEYVEHFRKRVLQDALTEATAFYWRKRAKDFERALPRPGDFTGQATPEYIEALRQRVTSAMLACSEKAQVALLQDRPEGPAPSLCPLCGTAPSPWSCSCGETRVGEAA